MKQNINIGFILALSFVIVYLVVKMWINPKFDHFVDNEGMSPEFSLAVENKRKEMNEQMLQQYDQDKRINSLSKKIKALRNDLKIIKSRENEELDALMGQLKDGNGVLGVESNRYGVVGGSNIKQDGKLGKNYNLNFNLDN